MRCVTLAAVLLAGTIPANAQTPEETATAALEVAPVWDGHNDVPIQLRGRWNNVLADFDFKDTTATGPDRATKAAEGAESES